MIRGSSPEGPGREEGAPRPDSAFERFGGNLSRRLSNATPDELDETCSSARG